MSAERSFEDKHTQNYDALLRLQDEERFARGSDNPDPSELEYYGDEIHRLKLDLGLTPPLSDEQRATYSQQLMDPATSHEEVEKISVIARRNPKLPTEQP